MFLPWTWNWYKQPETCKLNAQFRSERSNRINLPGFRFSTFSGNFPVGRTDETFSIYRRTERRATTSLIFVHSDIGADTQGIENSWWSLQEHPKNYSKATYWQEWRRHYGEVLSRNILKHIAELFVTSGTTHKGLNKTDRSVV